MITLHHNNVQVIGDVFELCRYRVANLTSFREFVSQPGPLAKIMHIEFQRGNKLPGTSSEALISSLIVMSSLFTYLHIHDLNIIGIYMSYKRTFKRSPQLQWKSDCVIK